LRKPRPSPLEGPLVRRQRTIIPKWSADICGGSNRRQRERTNECEYCQSRQAWNRPRPNFPKWTRPRKRRAGYIVFRNSP